jgi:hypothetical protein
VGRPPAPLRWTMTCIGSSSAASSRKTVGSQPGEGTVEIIGAEGKMANGGVDVAGRSPALGSARSR